MEFLETENTIRAALEEADRLLEQAESSANSEEVFSLCRRAIRELLLSFLTSRREHLEAGGTMEVNDLLAQCLAVEEEFAALVEVITYFTHEAPPLNEEEREILIDAANEVWDFILSYLPDNVL